MLQQISKKDNVSFTSPIIRSPCSERDELINYIENVSSDTVSTSITIFTSSSSISYFSDDGLSPETDYTSFTNPMLI